MKSSDQERRLFEKKLYNVCLLNALLLLVMSIRNLITLVALAWAVLLIGGCSMSPSKNVKRVGMVIGIKPEKLEEYKKLHADEVPGVRDLLNKYHMHNFNIFIQKMPDGNYYEFGYYEYTGADFEGDMKKLSEEPRNMEWLKVCDPMQIPLPGSESWTVMDRVYYNP